VAWRIALIGLFAACSLTVATTTTAAATGPCRGTHWVTVWGNSPSDADPGTTLAGQTIRTIVTPLGGGSQVRVALSNRFGAEPLLVGSAFVGEQRSADRVRARSNRRLRFGGRTTVAIPPGTDLVSDPVDLAVKSFRRLAVSVYVAASSLAHPTRHLTAMQSTYVAPAEAGNLASSVGGLLGAGASVSYARPIVTAVEARAPRAASSIVAFGDSLTDGLQAPGIGLDTDTRYPDFLARRLAASPRGSSLSVVNAGISGNALLTAFIGPFGPAAASRLRADVIDQRGVSDVIVLVGRNDFDFTEPPQLIGALVRVITRLEKRRLNVILGTFSPSRGGDLPPAAAADQAEDRLRVNQWIRRQRLADAVVDFDRALRDPAEHEALRPRFAAGDGPHLSAAGYRRMAASLKLSMFKGSACAHR
jgi:lysophospholipase L1-like esterase